MKRMIQQNVAHTRMIELKIVNIHNLSKTIHADDVTSQVEPFQHFIKPNIRPLCQNSEANEIYKCNILEEKKRSASRWLSLSALH